MRISMFSNRQSVRNACERSEQVDSEPMDGIVSWSSCSGKRNLGALLVPARAR
jgi:hypothetical protein